MKLVMSESCQPSKTALTMGLGNTLLNLGTSYRKWKVRMLGRS